MIQLFDIQPLNAVDSEFKQSPDRLQQIDGVVKEILTIGIPYEPERLRVMIIILGHSSCIQDSRIRFAIWRLHQDLIQIAACQDSIDRNI